MHKARRCGKDWVSDLSMRKFTARALVTTLTIVLALAGAVILGFAGAYQFLEPEIPDAAELRHVPVQLPLSVYSRDGKLIAQIGEQRRIPVHWEEIPPVLVDAVLAAEDDRFFEHPGVDWQGLVRAAASNVSAGGVREGGGTITMQLARNTVLTSERTLRRKLKEVFLALRLEREFSKQEILTLYLNRIFLGQRAYGVGAASQVYFDKRPTDLTLAEAALIAGLPRSPSLDNPVTNVDRARGRRAYVLRRMFETGKIDAAQRADAAAAPIAARIHGPVVELDAPYVAEMARLEMMEKYGEAALTSGLRVTTTVDSRLQTAAMSAARRTMLEYELGLKVHRFLSGPVGGDQQIGAKIAEGGITMLIFFWDPLEPQPHDPDVKALLRIGTVWNVPMACNVASADLMISSPLLGSDYEHLRPDLGPRGWGGEAPDVGVADGEQPEA